MQLVELIRKAQPMLWVDSREGKDWHGPVDGFLETVGVPVARGAPPMPMPIPPPSSSLNQPPPSDSHGCRTSPFGFVRCSYS